MQLSSLICRVFFFNCMHKNTSEQKDELCLKWIPAVSLRLTFSLLLKQPPTNSSTCKYTHCNPSANRQLVPRGSLRLQPCCACVVPQQEPRERSQTSDRGGQLRLQVILKLQSPSWGGQRAVTTMLQLKLRDPESASRSRWSDIPTVLNSRHRHLQKAFDHLASGAKPKSGMSLHDFMWEYWIIYLIISTFSSVERWSWQI